MNDLKENEVSSHLFIGGIADYCEALKRNDRNFARIVSLVKVPKVCLEHLEVIPLDWDEFYKDNKRLLEVIDFIQEGVNKNENVLVHCSLGQNRSVALVIAYLMVQQKRSFQECYEEVKELYSKMDLTDSMKDCLKSIDIE